MAVSYYERKTQQRMLGLINSRCMNLQHTTVGTIRDRRAISFVFAPETLPDVLSHLIEDAKKCFRKVDVIQGKGCHHQYAPEIIYPTIYLVIKGPNK